jgi:predicted nucleic acid-binding protein
VILADTSVWVEHFRRGMPAFAAALENGHVSIHAVVLGELACGNLLKRAQTLAALRSLPRAKSGTTQECLDLVEAHSLYGRGIGWGDVQLLVSARLSGDPLWSLDDRLAAAAAALGVAYANH